MPRRSRHASERRDTVLPSIGPHHRPVHLATITHTNQATVRHPANTPPAVLRYYYNSPNTKCRSYPTEDNHNNFIGLRYMEGSAFGDVSYAEYQTGNQGEADIDFTKVDFVEFFNLTADSWQMNNMWNDTITAATQAALHKSLRSWYGCQGDSCP